MIDNHERHYYARNTQVEVTCALRSPMTHVQCGHAYNPVAKQQQWAGRNTRVMVAAMGLLATLRLRSPRLETQSKRGSPNSITNMAPSIVPLIGSIGRSLLASLLGASDTVSGKHKVLSLEAKTSILEATSKDEKNNDVTARFGIPQTSLSTILNPKDSIIVSLKKGTSGQRKRVKAVTFEDADKAMFK
ncbi:hypothetical protein HPB50_016344 [Hyalomma asiaticum]|uniref:Uncharacterized protein n=1 Tax=Hyalomma asiaticum TaxID=266040 RepID=A0ACB7SEG2_HYAAI|nr:hypothetical protein HPB50_016344 [Hyalomma asiaticum]